VTTRIFVRVNWSPFKILPYQPNTLVSFMNTPDAVHSTNDVEGPQRQYVFTCMQTEIAPGDAMLDIGA
jgi:hypothetical protein